MIKRIFDIGFSLLLLLLLWLPLFICWILATLDTRSNGLFLQSRIGQYGKPFVIYKLKTMNSAKVHRDQNISGLGAFFRRYKVDELPQLLNILKGEMSVVGPRPDVPGYYDVLKGSDREVLSLKPGLTSEASLKYFNEAQLLAQQKNPKQYNDEVIFPDKVKMNLDYLQNQSFRLDLTIIFKTFLR